MEKRKVIHLYDYETLENAPSYILNEYAEQGMEGTKCGYVRKNVTHKSSEVTCKLCLKRMEKNKC